MKFKKIELGRQTNFLVAILLLHFLFFGYLANAYAKDIGVGVMFLYQVFFSPRSFLSIILLFGIIFLMAFREKFFEHGIRNSIWLIPVIVGMSWIWYWFVSMNIATINILDIFGIIGMWFISFQSYITILVLLIVNLTASLLASIARVKYNRFKERVRKIEI